jgi:hypothetical protein
MSDVFEQIGAAAERRLMRLLADMHDSADDESCLADDGDGSCFACQCFEALAEMAEEREGLVAALRKAEAALEGIVSMNTDVDIEQAREALAAIKAAREGGDGKS